MTTMRRRTFLQATSASLLGLSLGLSPKLVEAQDATYEGPFWIFIHGSGGWDPQFLFNPTERADHNRLYTSAGKVGNIPYAGWELDAAAMGLNADFDYTNILYSPRSFLERFGSRMTVVNGIDTTTNNHDTGTRVMASGKLTEGYPALGAMVATRGGRKMPLAFLAGGGYDATEGLVPAVRLSNVDVITRIAEPNLFNPGRDEEGYHTGATWQRIRDAQQARLSRLSDRQKLPALRRAIAGLSGARLADAELKKLVLPEPASVGGNLGGLQGAMRKAQLAVAAFKAGLAVSAGISVGGFDTHGDHDRNQPRALAQLLGAVGFALEEIERGGLTARTYVVVTSDFGRGPTYNGEGAGSGKDHWPITSVLAFGPNVKGNRVVGDTDDDQRAVAVDPDTLQPAKGGVIIGPEHVHLALRGLADLADGDLAREFPISGQRLKLFG
jgi:uncharacterized protein (DUF1501 family)